MNTFIEQCKKCDNIYCKNLINGKCLGKNDCQHLNIESKKGTPYADIFCKDCGQRGTMIFVPIYEEVITSSKEK